MNQFTRGLVGVAATFALAPMALAANVGIGTGVSAGLQVGSGVLTASSTGNANLGASASSSNASATGTAMRDEHAAATGLTITAADAAQGATLDSSTQVASDDDFAAFARGELKQNAAITAINSDSGQVRVSYREPGRFLGLFPVVMESSATVDEDGKVILSHPWYYFLTSSATDNAALAAAISTEAAATFNREPSKAAAGATSTAVARTSLSASERAQILAGITLALRSVIPTSVSGSAAASSTASY